MRRAAGGLLLLVVALLLLGWFFVVPSWRPPLRDDERYAIDVSHHQGPIDWTEVANDGIDAAYIKATEGGDFVDDRFADNWRGAQDAGLERGAYHFFTLCRTGADQARHFLAVVMPDAGALPPAVDLELGGNCSSRPAEQTVLAEVKVFLDLVERAWARPVVIYTNDDFQAKYSVRDLGRPLWEVSRPFRPHDNRWQIWQLHGYAKVDGIGGRVDLDVVRLPK
jgi:lysozyme